MHQALVTYQSQLLLTVYKSCVVTLLPNWLRETQHIGLLFGLPKAYWRYKFYLFLYFQPRMNSSRIFLGLWRFFKHRMKMCVYKKAVCSFKCVQAAVLCSSTTIGIFWKHLLFKLAQHSLLKLKIFLFLLFLESIIHLYILSFIAILVVFWNHFSLSSLYIPSFYLQHCQGLVCCVCNFSLAILWSSDKTFFARSWISFALVLSLWCMHWFTRSNVYFYLAGLCLYYILHPTILK